MLSETTIIDVIVTSFVVTDADDCLRRRIIERIHWILSLTHTIMPTSTIKAKQTGVQGEFRIAYLQAYEPKGA